MPRRRRGGSRVSTSSEQSSKSDLCESLNSSEELPDPGLPRSYRTDEPARRKPKEMIYDLTDDAKEQDPMNAEVPLNNQESPKNLEPNKNQDNMPNNQNPLVTAATAKNKKTAIDSAKKKNAATEKRKRNMTENTRETVRSQVESDKRACAELNKVLKPTECLKYVNIEIHPELASRWYMADMKHECAALGVRVVEAEDLCDPALIVWTRHVPPALTSEGGQVNLTLSKKQCDRAIYIITAEEMLVFIAEERVSAHLALKQELAGGKLTVVMFGAQNMLKNPPTSNGTPRMSNQRFKNAVSDLKMKLMVEKKIDLVAVETPVELGSLVTHYTRAIAEAPYKKAKRDIDEQADFYMRGDNKNCVVVDKDGNGLIRLWEQMIAILPMSSLEVARSLGAEYKTPRALSTALQASGGLAKIADIGVTRTNVPAARSRRLGPEFTRKLHTLFTCEDGNALIE